MYDVHKLIKGEKSLGDRNKLLIWSDYNSGVNIILSLIPDKIGLESTFWASKYTFCVIVNLNKLLCTCTTLQECVLHLRCYLLLKLSSNIPGKLWSTQKYTHHCSIYILQYGLFCMKLTITSYSIVFTTTFNRAHLYLGSRKIEFYWPLENI